MGFTSRIFRLLPQDCNPMLAGRMKLQGRRGTTTFFSAKKSGPFARGIHNPRGSPRRDGPDFAVGLPFSRPLSRTEQLAPLEDVTREPCGPAAGAAPVNFKIRNVKLVRGRNNPSHLSLPGPSCTFVAGTVPNPPWFFFISFRAALASQLRRPEGFFWALLGEETFLRGMSED